MGRRKDQERRRRALIDATMAVIADAGPSGVTARQVAARAGLSPAAVIYYFPQMDDLVAAVRGDAVRRFCVGRERIAEECADPAEALPLLLAAGLPSGPDDLLVSAIAQLFGAARREERHARLSTEFWLRQVGMYTRLIERGARAGVFRPLLPAGTAAEHLVALEDAYGVHIVGGNASLTRERALSLLLSYAEGVLGPPSAEGAAEAGGGVTAPR
ncbi:TetR/AcrR family transcriptional regulator [Nocardiopsis sp. CNT-189]|uniref:TetR/AcrR family transcriptional regulator n=1 Tax=Nocardiopsis oceanisediminis TaxID=2816862 RepID=UPI003B3117E7